MTLLNDLDEAAHTLKLADEIQRAVTPAPIQQSIYLRSTAEYLLKELEESLTRGPSRLAAKLKRRLQRATDRLVGTTQKAAQHRTEAFRLKGSYYQLLGKPKRAAKWFAKSIEEGNRLGARLELSRTYFETGKFLVQNEGNIHQIHGYGGKDYLERAGKLFAAMDLQWDQDRLVRLRCH